MPHTSTTQRTEIAIIGGGLVGMTLAVALAKANVPVTVIEAAPIEALRAAKADGRSSALAYGSYMFLEEIGVWEPIKEKSGAILDIRVTDTDSPLFLHYDHALVGDKPMGYMVENKVMRDALYDYAATLPALTLLAPCKTGTITRTAGKASITLEDGRTLDASLIIAAEGRNSPLRQQAGIGTYNAAYDQTGIVCTIHHEHHHEGLAQERFLPSGPFAVLPLAGGHHSSLVWTESHETAPLYLNMNKAQLEEHITARCGSYLGNITIVSEMFSYPLSLTHAKRYTDTRLALAGDAAHAIHPLAGQGFNLGIRDAIVLSERITEAYRLGLDVGSVFVLDAYEELRKYDAWTLIALTDGLNRLFTNPLPPIKLARRLGMAAVEHLPPLKRFFIRHAMGA